MMTEPFRDPVDQLAAQGGTMGWSWWRGWIAWDPGAQPGPLNPRGPPPLSPLLPGAGPQTRQTCVTQKVTLLL